MKKEKLTLKDITNWILDNSKETDAMDQINQLTFLYTSKYKNRYSARSSDSDDGVDYGK